MPVHISKKKFCFPASLEKKVSKKVYRQFLEKICAKKSIKQAVFTFPFSSYDPLYWLKNLDPLNEFLFYREKPDKSEAVAAGGSLVEITASGSGRFSEVQRQIKQAKEHSLHFNTAFAKQSDILFLGGFSFFDQIESEGWKSFKSASFVLAKRIVSKRNNSTSLSISVAVNDERSPSKIHEQVLQELNLFENYAGKNTFIEEAGLKNISKDSPIAYSDWKTSITDVKNNITKNKYDKVVLARELDIFSKTEFRPAKILKKLRARYSACTTYLIRPAGGKAFIGSSPERLLTFNGNLFQTEALAGSMPRGSDKESDLTLENKLNSSYKNKEEHNLVVKHFKNILAPIARSIKTLDRPLVKKLANVQHLYTPIHFKSNVPPLVILKKLHPTPALGGYPQKKAVAYLEKFCLIDRGFFGGPLGWISADGKCEFSVAIRCGLIGNNRAKLFAGCGIVANSNPENEWGESNLKFRPMLSALGDE